MKCQPQVEVGALGRLVLGLLVAVLADVGDAELGEQPDVGGREELGDHDQRDLVGVAAGVGAGAGDAAAHGVEAGRELVAAAHAVAVEPDHGRPSRPAASPSRR